MPGFDGTGPMGRGPMTGRGFGPCSGFAPGMRGPRRGFWGRRPGWRAYRQWSGVPDPYYSSATSNPEDEKAYLKEQAEQLRQELAEMEKRMAELEES
ncbi:MAG: DUF5320 domain-containing protein [Bacillota bacterium]